MGMGMGMGGIGRGGGGAEDEGGVDGDVMRMVDTVCMATEG